jgi:hypothetical protein
VQDSETYAEGLELTVIKLLLLLIAILFGLLLLPFVAVGLIFSGVFCASCMAFGNPAGGRRFDSPWNTAHNNRAIAILA